MTAITEDFEARTKSEAAQKLHEAGFNYAGFDDLWMSNDHFAKVVHMPASKKYLVWSIDMIDRTEEGLESITAKIDELEAMLAKLNEQRREIINYLGKNKK